MELGELGNERNLENREIRGTVRRWKLEELGGLGNKGTEKTAKQKTLENKLGIIST